MSVHFGQQLIVTNSGIKTMEHKQSSFILFKTEDEKISVDVRFEDETVWLSQEQMATLFGKGRSTITEHIQNIFKEG